MQTLGVEVFHAIAENGNLSSAARRLGLSPMTVSRRLSALEQELGVRLVHRTTRSTSLTTEGEAFVPHAKALIDAEAAARNTLRTGSEKAVGNLRVTAPTVFGQEVIMPLIPGLLVDNPMLQVDLILSDNQIDIVGHGLDIAIRIATLQDSELVARGLAKNPRILCASPCYLARKPAPTIANDLKLHDCIKLHSMPRWPFIADGERVELRPHGTFSANSVQAVRAACVQGLGIAMLTYWDVREELLNGALVPIHLEDAATEALTISALLPTRQQIPLRVTAFLNLLASTVNPDKSPVII